jgi:tetratricopeptide (TPR) repeat protein
MEADPENADYRYMSGSILLNLGLEVEALQRFEEVIPLRPEWLDPYLQIAGIHASHGNWVEVLSQAERAIEIAPERPEGYAYQGESLLAQDEFRLARDAFSEAIERGVHTPFVYLNRAWARHNLRDISGALSDYDRGFETPPDDSIWWYRYGFALFDGARYRESVDAFEAAQENGMDTADLYAGLALALDATIQRTAAEEVYLRAVSLEPEFSDPGFLSELSLWTQSSVNRAEAILRRIEASN